MKGYHLKIYFKEETNEQTKNKDISMNFTG